MNADYQRKNLSTLSLSRSETLRGYRLEWGGGYKALLGMIRGRRSGYQLDGNSHLQIKVNIQPESSGRRKVTDFRHKVEKGFTQQFTAYDFLAAAAEASKLASAAAQPAAPLPSSSSSKAPVRRWTPSPPRPPQS